MFLTPFRRSSRARGKSPRNPAGHRRLRVEPLEQRTLLSGFPAFAQQAELQASPGKAGNEFGSSTAISGGTMVVGSPMATVGGNVSQGTVFVFTDTATGWVQTSEITAYDGAAGDEFGTSVSISGGMMVVGAPFHAVGANGGQGEAYVYTESSLGWTWAAEFTASDGAAGDNFGASVAVSGNTVVVGAPLHTVGANAGQGAAYVFTKSGYSWPQFAELDASNGGASDLFGASVSISGNTVVVGAPGATVGAKPPRGRPTCSPSPAPAGPT